MTGADAHRRLYERWLLELWKGDEAVAKEILSEDFVIHQARTEPSESEAIRGQQAGLQMVRMGRAPFSELNSAIEVGGGIDIMRVRDGRLAEYWVSSDGLALMAQLGALG